MRTNKLAPHSTSPTSFVELSRICFMSYISSFSLLLFWKRRSKVIQLISLCCFWFLENIFGVPLRSIGLFPLAVNESCLVIRYAVTTVLRDHNPRLVNRIRGILDIHCKYRLVKMTNLFSRNQLKRFISTNSQLVEVTYMTSLILVISTSKQFIWSQFQPILHKKF